MIEKNFAEVLSMDQGHRPRAVFLNTAGRPELANNVLIFFLY